jgi:putative nucleotidyltransferase with HDIG domain
LDNVKNQLAVDAACIMIPNPLTHLLEYAAGIGFQSHDMRNLPLPLATGCTGRAVLEQQTATCSPPGADSGVCVRVSNMAGEAFISHFATPLLIKGQVKGVLEVFHREALIPERTWLSYLETLATQAAIAIENASLFESLLRSNTELTLAYDATIEGWSRALELRDQETEGHSRRVTEMVLELAAKMGVGHEEKIDIRRGALLHDIGKMGIPDSILLKPGRLSEDEWAIMRKHPLFAYQMLSPIPFLERASQIPYCHHEKWDGSGYPRGLKGADIPVSARLFAIVDVFDAITSDRPYGKARPREEACRMVAEQAGKHFDPQVVQLFLACFGK